jgi:hypothetical protein
MRAQHLSTSVVERLNVPPLQVFGARARRWGGVQVL